MTNYSENSTHPVYYYIWNMIIEKKLKPGDHIPETKIAKEFGVSRTPVRQAILQFAKQGIVTIYPHRFAKVAEYDEKTVRDIGTLRMSLDLSSIKLALLFGSPSDFSYLKKFAQQEYELSEQGILVSKNSHTSKFHLELTKLSKNKLLIQFQEDLYLRVQFILIHNPLPTVKHQLQLQEHLDIVSALMHNNEELARSIMCNHLLSIYHLNEYYPPNFIV